MSLPIARTAGDYPVHRTGGMCLVVDPDPRWEAFLVRTLKSHGLATAAVGKHSVLGETCLETQPACIFIDVDDDDFRAAIGELRDYCAAYVVAMTQRGQSSHSAVEALLAGADLVMTKPFTREALIAQVDALARRPQSTFSEAIPAFVNGDFRFDFASHTALLGGQRLHLSNLQYRLLEALARNPDIVLTHAQLIDMAWGSTVESSSENLRAHIHNLRRLLGDSPPRLILTERDIGYYMRGGGPDLP